MQQALLIFLLLSFSLYFLLIIYYWISWLSIPNTKLKTQNPKPQTKISVIIPARNEEKNIKACLDSLINQSYPNHLFEVLVIDDFSTDNTAGVVLNYASQNIKLISLRDFVSPNELNSFKKKAIETAIQQSTGELIITTDADCLVPFSWLQIIAGFYEEKKSSFIAAPVAFLPSPVGEGLGVRFLEIFQSLDFMVLQGITGASVHKKMHSMCNGANLAYTKKAFDEVCGFKDIDDIASGDDMLLMHKIYTLHPKGIAFLKSKDVIVKTQPTKNLGEFFNQRIRWASKASKYDDKRIFWVLLLLYLVNVMLLILPLIAIINNYQLSIINYQLSIFKLWLLLLLIKTLVELIFLYPVANFFNKKILLYWFPLMQPFHILYTVIAGWLGKFGNYKWKGRKVK